MKNTHATSISIGNSASAGSVLFNLYTGGPARLNVAAAGGIALINPTGNLGEFIGPSFVGTLKSATGGYASVMIALALVLPLSALAMLAVGRAMARQPATGVTCTSTCPISDYLILLAVITFVATLATPEPPGNQLQ